METIGKSDKPKLDICAIAAALFIKYNKKEKLNIYLVTL
jgi:hypothetical protein